MWLTSLALLSPDDVEVLALSFFLDKKLNSFMLEGGAAASSFRFLLIAAWLCLFTALLEWRKNAYMDETVS